jgi:hypothetical protein
MRRAIRLRRAERNYLALRSVEAALLLRCGPDRAIASQTRADRVSSTSLAAQLLEYFHDITGNAIWTFTSARSIEWSGQTVLKAAENYTSSRPN